VIILIFYPVAAADVLCRGEVPFMVLLCQEGVRLRLSCVLHKIIVFLTVIFIRICLLSSKIHNGDDTPKD
jgi:hypothetical protein